MTERVAVVTGGIGGLGSEICRSLARAGRRVVAADLGGSHEPRVAQFRDSLGDLAARVTFETVDVGSFDSCGELIRRVERDAGPIGILVNAAGITRDVTLRKMSTQQWTD